MATNKKTAAARPAFVGSVGLSRMTSNAIAEEEDDFEAAFLSDIHLPAKDNKQSKSSILTRSKLVALPPTSRPPPSMPNFEPFKHSDLKRLTTTSGSQRKTDQKLCSAKEFLDQLHRTKVFLSSNLPLLDMDPKLYSTLCDQYRQIRQAFGNHQSKSFYALTARHKPSQQDSGRMSTKSFSVVAITRLLYEQFYSHGLNQLSAETRQQLECGILGQYRFHLCYRFDSIFAVFALKICFCFIF